MNQLNYLRLLKSKARFENPQTASFKRISTPVFTLEQLFDLNDDQRVELYNSLNEQLPSNTSGLNRTGMNLSNIHQEISEKLQVLKEIDDYMLSERAVLAAQASKESLKKDLMKDLKKKQFAEMTAGKTAQEVEALIKSM